MLGTLVNDKRSVRRASLKRAYFSAQVGRYVVTVSTNSSREAFVLSSETAVGIEIYHLIPQVDQMSC